MTTVKMIRVGNDQICMIITVKVTVWAMKMDLCDHHRSQGDDGGDWFVDERSVIITAVMAWMYMDSSPGKSQMHS